MFSHCNTHPASNLDFSTFTTLTCQKVSCSLLPFSPSISNEWNSLHGDAHPIPPQIILSPLPWLFNTLSQCQLSFSTNLLDPVHLLLLLFLSPHPSCRHYYLSQMVTEFTGIETLSVFCFAYDNL